MPSAPETGLMVDGFPTWSDDREVVQRFSRASSPGAELDAPGPGPGQPTGGRSAYTLRARSVEMYGGYGSGFMARPGCRIKVLGGRDTGAAQTEAGHQASSTTRSMPFGPVSNWPGTPTDNDGGVIHVPQVGIQDRSTSRWWKAIDRYLGHDIRVEQRQCALRCPAGARPRVDVWRGRRRSPVTTHSRCEPWMRQGTQMRPARGSTSSSPDDAGRHAPSRSVSSPAMSFAERDVVIIGGGHNGLACAAYLAKAGLDVLVLEKRDVLGGAAHRGAVARLPGLERVLRRVADAAADRARARPEAVRLRLSIIAPDYFVPFPDGTSLTLWGDAARDAAGSDGFAADAERLRRVRPLLRPRRGAAQGPALRRPAQPEPARPSSSGRRRPGVPQMERARRPRGRPAVHDERRDFLDEWFEDDRVKGALATQAIIGAWCGPMTPGSAYVLMHHWIGEIDGHPARGDGCTAGWGRSQAMARSAQAAGAESAPGPRSSARDQREWPSVGVALPMVAGSRPARRLVRPSRVTTSISSGRSDCRGRRARRGATDAFGLGEDQRRATDLPEFPVLGPGG